MSWGEILTNTSSYFREKPSKKTYHLVVKTTKEMRDSDKENREEEKVQEDEVLGKEALDEDEVLEEEKCENNDEFTPNDQHNINDVENYSSVMDNVESLWYSGSEESQHTTDNLLSKGENIAMIGEGDFIPTIMPYMVSQNEDRESGHYKYTIKHTLENNIKQQSLEYNESTNNRNKSSNASEPPSKNVSAVSAAPVSSGKSLPSTQGSSGSLKSVFSERSGSKLNARPCPHLQESSTTDYCLRQREHKIGRYMNYQKSPISNYQDFNFSILATSPYFKEFINHSSGANRESPHLGQYISRMRGSNFESLTRGRCPQVKTRFSNSFTYPSSSSGKKHTNSPVKSKSVHFQVKHGSQKTNACSRKMSTCSQKPSPCSLKINPRAPKPKSCCQKMNPGCPNRNTRTNTTKCSKCCPIQRDFKRPPQPDCPCCPRKPPPPPDCPCLSMKPRQSGCPCCPEKPERRQQPCFPENPCCPDKPCSQRDSLRPRRPSKWNNGIVKTPYQVVIPLATKEEKAPSIITVEKTRDSEDKSQEPLEPQPPPVAKKGEHPVVKEEHLHKKKGKAKEQPPPSEKSEKTEKKAETKQPELGPWQKPCFSYSRKFQVLSQEICDQFYNPLFNYIPRKACVKQEWAGCPENKIYHHCPQSLKLHSLDS